MAKSEADWLRDLASEVASRAEEDYLDIIERVSFKCESPTLGNYRADFSVEIFDRRTRQRIYHAIIECDGHEFHERTKEQARRDKRRDRWFQTRGISVLRFTGSEIWADPVGCAEQITDAIFAAIRRRRHGRE